MTKQRINESYNDKRGLKQAGWNKTPEEDIDFVKNVINSLPKYESHYRREQTIGTQYLKLGMTVNKIYDYRIQKCTAARRNTSLLLH